MGTAIVSYLGICALISIGTFGLYGWDKRQARRGGRRIPEVALHLLELLGGWPGALIGQRTFRHKTRKLSFQLVFWSVVAVHLVLVGLVIYFLY